MKIYVFGNAYVAGDGRAVQLARELEGDIEGISFVFVKPTAVLIKVDPEASNQRERTSLPHLLS